MLSAHGEHQVGSGNLIAEGTVAGFAGPANAPAQELEARLRTVPILQDVAYNLQLRNPEIQLNILRDRASALGVTSQQIELALFNAFGGRKVSTLYGASDQYDVLFEVDRRYQTDVNAMESVFIQAPSGARNTLATRRGPRRTGSGRSPTSRRPATCSTARA